MVLFSPALTVEKISRPRETVGDTDDEFTNPTIHVGFRWIHNSHGYVLCSRHVLKRIVDFFHLLFCNFLPWVITYRS